MENISSVGVDVSKNVFHLVGVNHSGRIVLRRRLQRANFIKFMKTLRGKTVVYLESGASAHYWSRELAGAGLTPKQVPPQFVKPFLKSQKNDFNDAEAIVEAGQRPSMRFVATKQVGQLELQSLHRVRERLVGNRTALFNQIRAVLAEQGIVLRVGPAAVRQYLEKSCSDEQKLSASYRILLQELWSELLALDGRIVDCEEKLKQRARSCPVIQRLMSIPGIGLLTATSLACAHGNPREFKNGRQFAAWLGLVPRQHSSGGKSKLLGITKRGDTTLRSLLVQGARTVIRHAKNKKDPYNLWVVKLQAAKGTNLAAVALANKNARIAWKILTSSETFDTRQLRLAA